MRWRGNLLLLLAAFIWGTTFVAQQVGMDRLGPFTYAAGRYFLGMLALAVLWYGYRGARETARRAGTYQSGWKAGMGAGAIMFCASSLQQVGMQYTTVGKASCITCLYLILVPLAGVFLKQHIRLENWAGAVLALTGLYFLCVKESLSLGYGDALLLICSVFWTMHILYIGANAALVDVIELSLSQVGVTFLGSMAAALAFETFAWEDLFAAWFPIFYGGVLSTGVAFTLQIIGQKYAEPASAAILMSLESVFGALGGWALLGERLAPIELFGCVLMAAGMLVTQLGGFWRKKAKD